MTRCFICDQEGTVHLIGTVYACQNHSQGTAKNYMEGDTDD